MQRSPDRTPEIDKLLHRFRRWNHLADYRMEYSDLLDNLLQVVEK